MTNFHIEVDLTCPSNWREEDVRKFVGKILTGEAEHGSLRVEEIRRAVFRLEDGGVYAGTEPLK